MFIVGPSRGEGGGERRGGKLAMGREGGGREGGMIQRVKRASWVKCPIAITYTL